MVYNKICGLYGQGYLLTGRKDYLEAVVRAFEFVQDNHMQPHGVHSSYEFLSGIRAFKGSETCNVANFMAANLILLRATGEARYADRIEKAFYNAGQRMVSHGYKTHVYHQMPNRIPGVVYEHEDVKTHYIHEHEPICCCNNFTRALPNFLGNAIQYSRDGGMAVLLYGPLDVQAEIDTTKLTVSVVTSYPFSEDIRISLSLEAPKSFPFHFRVPGWCASPALSINGESAACAMTKKGFICINREWGEGDVIDLSFPMNLCITERCEKLLVDEEGNEPYFARYGEDRNLDDFVDGAPYVTVERGPLLFALPLDRYSDAQHALVWDRDAPEKSFKVQIHEMEKDWDWSHHAPVTIEAQMQRIDWDFVSGNPEMPPEPYAPQSAAMKMVQLVPYGTPDFRISMFPVIQPYKATPLG